MAKKAAAGEHAAEMTGRRNPTKADGNEWALTPQQQAAVDVLATGRTLTETAEAVGVTRQTVSEWRNQHHGFRAELNARRQELWHEQADRLRALVPKALDVLVRELDGENPLPAAVHVLKACGAYTLGAPTGPATVEDVELEDYERKGDRATRAEFAIRLGSDWTT